MFKAGAAKSIITPKIGTCLYGYVPHHRSESVHDQLSVTALALSDGEKTALVMTAEIGNLQTELSDETRAAISARCGVPFENVLISCTHTHSAPNLAGTDGWGEVDREYFDEFFLPGAISAAKNAVESLVCAEYAVGVTESRVGINRREQRIDGSIALGQNPHGCFDPYMTVISFREKATKKGILNLVHYSCHGTAAGLNREITRDWSGILIDRLEEDTGTLTAYYNGACGDVGPRLTNGGTTGDIRHVESLGGAAALDAMRAYKALGGYREAKLDIFPGELSLPYQKLPSLETALAGAAKYEHPETLNNLGRLDYAHWVEVAEHLKAGKCPEKAPFVLPQTLISLGDVLFVPYPYELFSEIAMRLREYSPFPHTLVLTNANGTLGYLPSEDQLCRGGYEVECFKVGHLFALEESTDQNLINGTLGILRENGML